MQVEDSRSHGSTNIGPRDAAPGPTFVAHVARLALWVGVGVALLAGTCVFWGFDALPFQDLPAHAGLIALRHRYAASPFDHHFFVLADHLGPYSLFRWLGDRFDTWLGPVGAVRALATLPFLGTPLAVAWARHRLHRDRSPAAAYYAIALGFGFMTLLGFASYLLGLTAVVVGLTLWLEALAAPTSQAPKREAVAACFAPLVFLAHGDAFVLLLTLAFASALAEGDRPRRLARLRAFAPAATLAVVSAWRDRASVVPPGSAAIPGTPMALHFQGPLDKLSLLLTPTLMTRWGVDVVAGIALWTIVLFALATTARSLLGAAPVAGDPQDATSSTHSRALLAGLVALAAAFTVLPHSIGWFGFVDGRLVSLWLLVALLAVRRAAIPNRLRTIFDRAAPAVAFAVVGVALIASRRFQAEAAGWRETLAQVPEDARVLNLPLDPNSDIFTAHPFVHYDKLILAERPALVSDVWFHQGTGLYPTASNPVLRLPSTYSSSDLRGIDWPAYRLDDWDYVLVRTRPSAAPPDVPASLRMVFHRSGWWLFRSARSTPVSG